MSRLGRFRHWDHRQLGLHRTRPSAAALAHADAVLTEVGGRIPADLARDLAPDPVRLALLDFVADIDLTVEADPAVPAFDPAAYRRALTVEMTRVESPVLARRTPIRQRFLLPAMSAATAAVVLIGVLVAGRGGGPGNASGVGSPATAASNESQVLLRHASLLLTAASTADQANRTALIHEARSDLQHVSKLLPLISPPNRPPVRIQLRSLEQRSTKTAKASAGGHHKASSSGTASKSGQSTTSKTGGGTTGSGSQTTPPAGRRHHPTNPSSGNQPPASGGNPTGSNPSQQDPTGSTPTQQDPTGRHPIGRHPFAPQPGRPRPFAPGTGFAVGDGPVGSLGPGSGLGQVQPSP